MVLAGVDRRERGRVDYDVGCPLADTWSTRSRSANIELRTAEGQQLMVGEFLEELYDLTANLAPAPVTSTLT